MRQVRFVKQGDEADHVVLETVDGDEQFVLLVDAAMRDAVRADLPRLKPGPQPPAPISPRDIQARVRAGDDPAQIAAENDMSIERVMRFAGPVLDERTRIAGEAKRARAHKDGGTGSGLPVQFGVAVDERFAAHGIDPSTVRWDARRGEDHQWIVTATWLASDGQGGETERSAAWHFALSGRLVSPIDQTATDLLSDRPIRPVVPPPPPEEVKRPIATVVPPTAPGVVAFPAQPHATTGKLPNIDPDTPLFDQDALEPELPLGLPVEPAIAKVTNLGVAHRGDHDGEDQRPERARIPSWDDILLGVRRKGD